MTNIPQQLAIASLFASALANESLRERRSRIDPKSKELTWYRRKRRNKNRISSKSRMLNLKRGKA